eukprot:10837508-Alexandrium_andersonii.AAC.1
MPPVRKPWLKLQQLRNVARAPSALGSHLKHMYLTGRVTAGEVGIAARAAGQSAPDLAPVAKAKQTTRNRRGKVAADSRNSARSLNRALEKQAKFRLPYYAMVPCWDDSLNRSVDKKVAIMPIHETLDTLAASTATTEEWTSLDDPD